MGSGDPQPLYFPILAETAFQVHPRSALRRTCPLPLCVADVTEGVRSLFGDERVLISTPEFSPRPRHPSLHTPSALGHPCLFH